MKNYRVIYVLLMVLVSFVSCRKSEVKSSAGTKRLITMDLSEEEKGVKTIPVETVDGQIRWGKSTIRYVVDRKVDESLDLVVTGTGVHYKDNKVALKINRDGKAFFNKSFTKNSFASIIGPNFLKYAILESIAFNEVAGEKLLFSASVVCPDTDLVFPVTLAISSSGQLSMSAEKLMDESEDQTDN